MLTRFEQFIDNDGINAKFKTTKFLISQKWYQIAHRLQKYSYSCMSVYVHVRVEKNYPFLLYVNFSLHCSDTMLHDR